MPRPSPRDPDDTRPPADARTAWAASGAAWLTGHADGPPLAAPAALVPLVTEAFSALVASTSTWTADPGRTVSSIDPMALLGERAALAGLHRRGRLSCGGSSTLVRCRDGWVAVTLSRDDDLELVPAWFGGLGLEVPGVTGRDAVPAWLGHLRTRHVADVVGHAAEFGLAVAGLGEQRSADPVRWVQRRRGQARRDRPRVVDLSSLWAGPLCTSLLVEAGAEVVKVESAHRPDGLRRDGTGLFDLLNTGKSSVVVDLERPGGAALLQMLIEDADVVVEASRPRALRQLGIDPERFTAAGRPALWLSITGHGRDGDAGARVGFGDDAAVAGGLVARDGAGDPCFLGDAVADPLTGIVAASAVATAWANGDAGLIDLAMSRVAAAAAAGPEPGELEGDGLVARPRHRALSGHAPALGAQTDDVCAAVRERGALR